MDAYAILALFLSVCSLIIGFAQFLFTVYTYLCTRGYVCLSVCCSCKQSEDVDAELDVITFTPQMSTFNQMDVKETWV